MSKSILGYMYWFPLLFNWPALPELL